MSTTYPGVLQTFTNPQGTSKQSSPDHASQHADINDTVTAIETVLGTTAGTSVFKNFAAGDFPARINSSNVLQQTLQGTLNSSVIGTPSLTGGTISGAIYNNGTLGTPAITGGTLTNSVINTATVGTPTITGGTYNSPFIGTPTVKGTVQLQDVGLITQTGTADHITLTAGASKLVKKSVLRQDGTTNTYSNNYVTHVGWGYIQGDGANTRLSKAVTYGINFASAPIVSLSFIGIKQNSAPTVVTDFTSTTDDRPGIRGYSWGSTGFTAEFESDVNMGTVNFYGFSWVAHGAL